MRINSIRVKNFRCFEELTINLNKNYTVLIGINGTGKSTILDAISIGLGSYIAGFQNISSTIADSRKIMEYSGTLQEKVRSGNKEAIIARYSNTNTGCCLN